MDLDELYHDLVQRKCFESMSATVDYDISGISLTIKVTLSKQRGSFTVTSSKSITSRSAIADVFKKIDFFLPKEDQ